VVPVEFKAQLLPGGKADRWRHITANRGLPTANRLDDGDRAQRVGEGYVAREIPLLADPAYIVAINRIKVVSRLGDIKNTRNSYDVVWVRIGFKA
jgi:hypothetical protein